VALNSASDFGLLDQRVGNKSKRAIGIMY